ncbi:hypothetical protein [Actinoplanes sp. NPDC026670]|uniref:hypothetical protein n=1 Tax=Actinoplanes sp. NPDC026670 TaxID=3154700 RepID=UPI0033CF03C7
MRKLIMALAAGVAGTVVLGGSAMALAENAAADDAPSLVEDFSYPGAAAIEADRGIKLIKGDGNLVLVDCGADPNLPPADVILVQTTAVGSPDKTNHCFKASGTSGVLTMEIGEVYFIRGEAQRTVAAKVEVQDATPVTETEQVDPGEWQPIGIGQGRGEATLLELRYPFTS